MIISIDLWGTLIKGSPYFSDAKVALTKLYFDKDTEFILKCYSDSKKELNNLIELSGFQPSNEEIFRFLMSKLNGSYYSGDVLEFMKEYQKLAINLSPQLYSLETLKYMEKFKYEAALYLSSNTMLISGTSLEVILDKLGLLPYFSKLYFSDKQKCAKPNKLMYGSSNWHIGDNIRTDEIGAICAGSKSIIINSNNKTIKDAYNIITQVQ